MAAIAAIFYAVTAFRGRKTTRLSAAYYQAIPDQMIYIKITLVNFI